MKTLSTTLFVSAIGLAFVLASPAEAAEKGKKRSVQVPQSQIQRAPGMMAYNSGGVRAGPLYNGQDYIGEDPDPGIRAYLIKDMTRYTGSY